jgi:hypothetical protein
MNDCHGLLQSHGRVSCFSLYITPADPTFNLFIVETRFKSLKPASFIVPTMNLTGYAVFLITGKVSDARRRGATTEAYSSIRRKPAPAEAGGGAIEGNAAGDALMVIRNSAPCLTLSIQSSIFAELKEGL